MHRRVLDRPAAELLRLARRLRLTPLGDAEPTHPFAARGDPVRLTAPRHGPRGAPDAIVPGMAGRVVDSDLVGDRFLVWSCCPTRRSCGCSPTRAADTTSTRSWSRRCRGYRLSLGRGRGRRPAATGST